MPSGAAAMNAPQPSQPTPPLPTQPQTATGTGSGVQAGSTASQSSLPSAGTNSAGAPQAGSSQANAARTGAPPAATPSAATTPKAALNQAVREALATQSGMAPLFANLAALSGSPLAASMPNAVLQVAAQLMGLRLSADGSVSGESVKKAIAQSGLFLEKSLANAGAGAQQPSSPGGDMKASLLMLRSLLQSWLGADGDEAALQALAANAGLARPAAPKRGALPEGQRPASSTLDTSGGADKAQAAGRHLLDQTEAALSRLRLSQFASRSDGSDASVHRASAGNPQITLDIPIALGKETAVAQFTVERDGKESGRDGEISATWRVRFAVDMEPLGPVRALIAMRGEAVDVTLWAERPETAALFTSNAGDLRDGLARADFSIDDVRCWAGKPPEARKSGSLVDKRS